MKDYELLENIDARVWAVEFMERFRGNLEAIDEQLMISWFANAIMAGYDKARKDFTE